MTANQLIAYNLRRLRTDSGQTQEQIAQFLKQYLGKEWSSSSFSVAERSADEGARKREFDVNELLALAVVFGKPIGEFFQLPADVDNVYCGDLADVGRPVRRQQLEDARAPVNYEDDPIAAIRQATDRLERERLGRQAVGRSPRGAKKQERKKQR